MELLFDLNHRYLLSIRGGESPLASMRVKRGDDLPLTLEMFSRGLSADPGAVDTIIFVLKDTIAGEPLALANEWTGPVDGVWAAALDTATEDLTEWLGNEKSKSCMGELSFRSEGRTISSRILAVTIENDLWKGTEGTPLNLPTPDEWLAERGSYQWDLGKLAKFGVGGVTIQGSGYPGVDGIYPNINTLADGKPVFGDVEISPSADSRQIYHNEESGLWNIRLYSYGEETAYFEADETTYEWPDLVGGWTGFLNADGHWFGRSCVAMQRLLGNSDALWAALAEAKSVFSSVDASARVDRHGVLVVDGDAITGMDFQTYGVSLVWNKSAAAYMVNFQGSPMATLSPGVSLVEVTLSGVSVRKIGDEVVTGDFVPEPGRSYVLEGGTIQVYDPTPTTTGDFYQLTVASGTAVIGGVTYQASRFPITRHYNGAAWITAEPVITGTLTVGSGTWNGALFTGAQTFSGQVELTGQALTNATSAVTREEADRRFGSSGYTSFITPGTGAGLWVAAQTGTGTNESPAHGASISSPLGAFYITCKSDANSTGKVVAAGFIAQFLVRPGTADWNSGINYSKPICWSLRFYNGIAPLATMVGWVKFGGVRSPEESWGGPTARSVGLKQVGTALYGYVHNGTTLTVSAVNLQTIVVGVVHLVEIVGNGAGTYKFYVNRVLKDTLSGGPTGNGGADTLLGLYVSNGASAGNQQIAFTDLSLSYLS